MTRKEALKEIAQWLMCHDDEDYAGANKYARELVNLFGKTDCFYIGIMAGNLSSVAELEAELLLDGFLQRVVKEHLSYAGKQWWTVRNMNEDGAKPVYAGAPTEPLARLAALCLALAEMEM